MTDEEKQEMLDEMKSDMGFRAGVEQAIASVHHAVRFSAKSGIERFWGKDALNTLPKEISSQLEVDRDPRLE